MDKAQRQQAVIDLIATLANHVDYPADLVDSGTTRVETSGHNGSASQQDSAPYGPRFEPSRNDGHSPIPGDGEQIQP